MGMQAPIGSWHAPQGRDGVIYPVDERYAVRGSGVRSRESQPFGLFKQRVVRINQNIKSVAHGASIHDTS